MTRTEGFSGSIWGSIYRDPGSGGWIGMHIPSGGERRSKGSFLENESDGIWQSPRILQCHWMGRTRNKRVFPMIHPKVFPISDKDALQGPTFPEWCLEECLWSSSGRSRYRRFRSVWEGQKQWSSQKHLRPWFPLTRRPSKKDSSTSTSPDRGTEIHSTRQSVSEELSENDWRYYDWDLLTQQSEWHQGSEKRSGWPSRILVSAIFRIFCVSIFHCHDESYLTLGIPVLVMDLLSYESSPSERDSF